MRPHSLHATAGAVLFALAGLTACADSTQTTGMASQSQDPGAAARYAEFTGQETASADCVAAGGTTMDGMPATPHQMQVLDDEIAGAVATEPAAGCADAGGMPATPHQQQLLDDSATQDGGY